MTTKSELWRRISYKVPGSDTIIVHKGSSRYSRWYVIDTAGTVNGARGWKYLSKGYDSKEAAFGAATLIIDKFDQE